MSCCRLPSCPSLQTLGLTPAYPFATTSLAPQSNWLLDNSVPAAWRRHLPAVYEALLSVGQLAYAVLGPDCTRRLDAALGITRAGHWAGGASRQLAAAVQRVARGACCQLVLPGGPAVLVSVVIAATVPLLLRTHARLGV